MNSFPKLIGALAIPASLYRIRKKWESEHTLLAAEWDVLAHYVQIGTEEEAQEPPLLRPAIPSRESYLAQSIPYTWGQAFVT